MIIVVLIVVFIAGLAASAVWLNIRAEQHDEKKSHILRGRKNENLYRWKNLRASKK